jgi:hypothetical protein
VIADGGGRVGAEARGVPRQGRRAGVQGRDPRRGGRDRPAAVDAHEDEPARVRAAPLRCRQHARGHRRCQPHGHQRGGNIPIPPSFSPVPLFTLLRIVK